ncbi:hypothetical protein AX16_006100 [Volvariella volvacea WC 439]|nr:hypothetical protein AX16_006100 [Volvariella volvacea WC 439]
MTSYSYPCHPSLSPHLETAAGNAFKLTSLPDVREKFTSASCPSEGSTPSSSASSLSDEKPHKENNPTDESSLLSGIRGPVPAVIGSCFAILCSFGQSVAFGTYQDYYATHLLAGRSAGEISWIGSAQFGVLFALGFPVGRAYDAYGPRLLAAIGTFIIVTSLILTSCATEYWQLLLAHGILFGAGSSLMFFPFIASLSSHCRGNTLLFGLAMSATNIGGIVYPPLLNYLLTRFGFPLAMRTMGCITAACCVCATICINRRPRSPSQAQSPHASSGASIARLKQDIDYIILVLGCIFVGLGLFIPFIYIVHYTTHLNLETHAYVTLSLMNLGGILGRLAPEILFKGVPPFYLLTGSTFLSALSCLVFWLPGQRLTPLVYVFVITYGIFSGVFITVLVPCVAETTRDMSRLGRRVGGLYSIVSVPTILSAPAAGFILQRVGHSSTNGGASSFDWTIVFTALTMLLGAVIFTLRLVRLRRPPSEPCPLVSSSAMASTQTGQSETSPA